MNVMRPVFLLLSAAVLALNAGCATTGPAQLTNNEAVSSADQSDNQRRASIRLQLAVGYYEQRQLPIALDELRQALLADPMLADAYSVRGLIYMETGENRLAEENFLQALKLAPNAPDYNNNYGWFLCQTGRERQSIAYFDNALKSRSYQSPAKALANAGVCSLKLNDTKNAERYLVQAFEQDPGNPAASVNLARVYFAQGDDKRARFYVARALKSDVMTADLLWLGIKIERKLGDRAAESSLVNQLRRRHPGSPEYAAYQRGAFNE